MSVDKRWLPPLPKNAERGKEVYVYPDGSAIHASSCQIHDDGGCAVLYRAAAKRFGRGWVSISEVPHHLVVNLYAVSNNEWQDAYFRAPEAAAEMLYCLGLGPACL
jgi:hypothetical protein